MNSHARASLETPERPELASLPPGALSLLRNRLERRRLLDVRSGIAHAFDDLLEQFFPERLVGLELDPPGRVLVPEPAGAFDGAFLFGLLPQLADPSSNLFDEIERVLVPGGLIVASTPARERRAAIPSWALAKAGHSLDIVAELTRARFELLDVQLGLSGVGRMLVVLEKKA